MIRFLGLLALVSVAYVVGESQSSPSAQVASYGSAAPGGAYHRMAANDDGLGDDVVAIVRDGAGEIGSALRDGVTGAVDGARGGDSAAARAQAPRLAEDVARAASKVSRRVLGRIVIRVCPSLNLYCGYPS